MLTDSTNFNDVAKVSKCLQNVFGLGLGNCVDIFPWLIIIEIGLSSDEISFSSSYYINP